MGAVGGRTRERVRETEIQGGWPVGIRGCLPSQMLRGGPASGTNENCGFGRVTCALFRFCKPRGGSWWSLNSL